MVLRVKDLSFSYGKRVILSNVSLHVSTPETLAILGINGVGKSTLIKAIMGLIECNSGKILLNDMDINKYDNKTRAKLIGYVPQKETNPFGFLVKEVVLMGRNGFVPLFKKPTCKDIKKADEAMEIVGITHLKERTYNELSGGEMQLVMIARALSSFPSFIIMDEPISHLDVGRQNQVLSLIKMLKKEFGIGIIITSHYPDHVLAVCDDTLFLKGENGSKFGKSNELMNEKELKELFNVGFISLNLEGQNRIIPKWDKGQKNEYKSKR